MKNTNQNKQGEKGYNDTSSQSQGTRSHHQGTGSQSFGCEDTGTGDSGMGGSKNS